MSKIDELKNKYEDISKDMSEDLKPLFDRLVNQVDAHTEAFNDVDTTEYAPPCGITKRTTPLTAEQKKDLERQVDIVHTSISKDPSKYKEISGMSKSANGSGTGKGNSSGYVRYKQMPTPKWLEDIKSSVAEYFEREVGRKGIDYEELIKGRYAKAKDKIFDIQNSVYVLLDTSGSMWFGQDSYGNSLLQIFASYFPTIAEDYSGQIWFVDSAPYNEPLPISQTKELSDFREENINRLNIDSGGGGTDFDGALDVFKRIETRMKQENAENLPLFIMMSDFYVDFNRPHLLPENAIFITQKGLGVHSILNVDDGRYIDGKKRKVVFVNTKGKI